MRVLIVMRLYRISSMEALARTFCLEAQPVVSFLLRDNRIREPQFSAAELWVHEPERFATMTRFISFASMQT